MSPTDLERFGFVKGLDPRGRERLAAATRLVRARPGQVLVRCGDRVAGVFLVVSGSLRVYYVDQDGREGTLYTIEVGEACILAQTCSFTDRPYPAWAGAESEAEIAVIEGAVFRELFREAAPVQRFVFDSLAATVNELMANVERVARRPIEARLAAVLLRLADAEHEVHLGHEALAKQLGTVREVVSRTLGELRRRGLVHTRRGCVVLLDRDALQAEASR